MATVSQPRPVLWMEPEFKPPFLTVFYCHFTPALFAISVTRATLSGL